MGTRCLRGLDCFAVTKCSSNPSLAVASEGFFDSEDFFRLPLGFELRTATMAFLVWKEMDADLPETRNAEWPNRTKWTAAGP